jgi:hypothetical protein
MERSLSQRGHDEYQYDAPEPGLRGSLEALFNGPDPVIVDVELKQIAGACHLRCLSFSVGPLD